jgi:hypothetical protein
MYSFSAGSNSQAFVFFILPYLIGITVILIADILVFKFVKVLRNRIVIVSAVCGLIIGIPYLIYLINSIDRYSSESAEAVCWLLFFHGMPFSLLGLWLGKTLTISGSLLFNSILFAVNWAFIGLLLGYAMVLILELRKELSHGSNH